jgi:hypothetical protein
MAAFDNLDIVRTVVKLIGQAGDVYQNVYHHRYSGPGADFVDLVAAVGDWLDDLYGNIQPAIPSDVAISTFDVTNITQDQVYPEVDIPGQTTGGGTGDVMPEQCCALVLGRTGAPKISARKFLGPFIEAANDDGAWYATLLGMLASFGGDWLVPVTFDGGASVLSPVVVHYTTGGNYTTVTPIEGFSINTGIYTQRRRRRTFGG